ncbi:serine/threonine protein kinase [Candidatus Micrarchaeota archaeon]|nr:serine/threonine protein kinase [Candidatus Micrarchaeota archaeon]
MQRMRGGKPQGKPSDKFTYEAFHDVRKLSAADPLAGAVINERYEMIGRVGSGGMARIYLAMDRETHSRVAVKIIGDNAERSEEVAERFFVEAKAAGKINHPNIIAIKDIGTYKDKIFCVMEFLEGFALSALLEKRQGMPWARARNIIAQVCDALEAAHNKGVIHRDMKPENVMLVAADGGRERVKVLDFGLAKLADSKERLTRENMVLGTVSYMAPEQAWSSEYDHRVDIYAVGVMAYEMVCGRVPFASDIPDDKARTLQILLMHKEAAPESMRIRKPDLDIPPEAEAAIMRALEKDPGKRFASAREMKEALLGPEIAQAEAKKAGMSAPPAKAEIPQTEEEGEWTLPREEETFGAILKRAAKRLLIFGAVAAAIGIPAYHFQNEIMGLVNPARREAGGGKEAPAPNGSVQAAPSQTSYQARIESAPRGAIVMDITGGEAGAKALGVTPLDITFQNWENVLLLKKAGYHPERIVVTRSQPEQKVSLRRIQRGGNPRSIDAGETGGNGTQDTDEPGGSRKEAP